MLLGLACHAGMAQKPQRDTLSLTSKIHQIDEVVVTGARHETDVRHLSQTVSVVGRAQIESALQPSLLPVLTEQVPGLFVTSRGIMGYGVSTGAAGGISLRGLSGGTARLMVMIDGHPQYAGIFGHPIADAYQSFLAERVEVLRGPASVLYGSNAMGGVINIVTRKMQEDGVDTHLHAGYGSYNTLETELTNRVRKERFSSVVSGSYNRTDGHRTDMGFEQYGGYAKLGYEVAEHWNLHGDVNVTHFNASYPGPITAPLLDGDQRITRGVTSFAMENRYEKTSGAWSFFYNWGNHWINDGYTPSAGEGPQDARFNSRDHMMGVSLYQSSRFFKGNRITFGFDWFRYGGHAWNEYVSGENAGTSADLVDKQEDELAFSQQLMNGKLQYGVNLFFIDGKNLIQTLPNPNGSGMLNQNSGEIENAGVEVQAAYRIDRHWSVDGNYSYLHMKNPVIAAPEHKLYAGTSFSRGRWNVSTGLQYIAGLYTQTVPVVTEDFVLWNLRATFRVNRWLDIWACGENLLAQKYEINAGYPMPRATVMAGINLNFYDKFVKFISSAYFCSHYEKDNHFSPTGVGDRLMRYIFPSGTDRRRKRSEEYQPPFCRGHCRLSGR